ncbi:MAG: chemotaxis protein CheB [Gammaproteobacteria bacterium]
MQKKPDSASNSSDEFTKPTLVVGIGASAGGLEAFKQLLPRLPAENGMAYILVQHLDPNHKSILTELLAPCTRMPVKAAEQGDQIHANVVYIIRPDTALGVRNGKLELSVPTLHHGMRLPVDHLFRSLAREFGPHAAGIVLSGAGSDGSAALRDIKEAGGLTMAQEPSTCMQPGMPQSAIDRGVVDLVLPFSEMPAALVRFERLLSTAQVEQLVTFPQKDEPLLSPSLLDDQAFAKLAALLEAVAEFDLRVYKSGTVSRRVFRRMCLAGYEDVNAYLDRLSDDPAEQRALVHDFLIRVTEFFRDPGAFEELRSLVVEPLVAAADAGETLRVWVPGCATGEEAYSIAIEFLDAMERRKKQLSLQIFATDVDQDALAVGRQGIFLPSIADRIASDRLNRYFNVLDGKGYQVRSLLRDTVSFAVHDLTKDPPFSRMNLVSCRNLLIYLRSAAQEHVLKLLHFALNPDCYLFLGSSETVGVQRHFFTTLSTVGRIYRKIGASRPFVLPRGTKNRSNSLPDPLGLGTRSRPAESDLFGRRGNASGELAHRVVMQARVPPTIVVSGTGTVLFMHGDLRPYLRFPEGNPRFNLMALVTPDLMARTRAALYKCRRDKATVVAFSSPGAIQSRRIKITASPAFELAEDAVVLSFEETDETAGISLTPESQAHEAIVDQLEQELLATREDLRHTIEELESANEELRSSNEESMSMNEEIQSANEELEATTEELRSLNEELTTVNAQLREKVLKLEHAHDDIANFFASTKIATLFLDDKLRIKRFTPAAEDLLRIDNGDEGRFVGDIARELFQNGLVEEARHVLEHLSGKRSEYRMQDGRWIARQILPYRTESRRIDGVVVTWLDITDLKLTGERLAVRERQQAVVARLGIRALEASDLQSFLDQTVREIQQTLETDFCKILELQPGAKLFLLRAGLGWREGLVGQATVPAGLDSQAGFTLMVQEPVIVDDLGTEVRFEDIPLLREHSVRSGISCLIRGCDETYGVLGAYTRQLRSFTREDANFLQAVATVIAGAVNHFQNRVRLLLEGAAAKALADAKNLHEAVSRIQAAAASEIGITLGELWQQTPDGEIERTAMFGDLSNSEAAVEHWSGPTRFGPDQSLVGRVFAQCRAEWLTSLQDSAQFHRIEFASFLGLTSGLALPIMSGAKVIGVITFFAKDRIYADSAFLRSLDAIGRSIGDFVRRLEIERRLRTTIDNAPVGISERALTGRWLHVNPRLCEITGYTQEEMLAASFADFTHPEDAVREAKLYAELCEGRRSKFTLEKRYVRKDGSPIWVNLCASLVTHASGKPDYCVAVVEDISARKAAEDELRDSEARFRLIVLNTPAPTMIYDELGGIVALSRSWTAMTGFNEDDIPTLETWLEKAFQDKSSEAKKLKLAQVIEDRGETERRQEFEILTQSGENRTVVFTSVPLGKNSEGLRLYVCTAVDITERRRFEKELVEAGRQKDEFIAMLSHELRNPLAAIRNATQVLKCTYPEDRTVQRMRAILERQIAHMAKLLDGLLDVSRIIRGKICLDKQVLDVGTIVRDVVDAAAVRNTAGGPQIRLETAGEPLWIEGDAVRLAQIVDNLLSNAIKYTGENGAVTVKLVKNNADAVFTVCDTGSGISPELLSRLFEPFQQAQQSIDRSQGGLGLGLTLVKQLVGLHGGTVEAFSEGSGKGSEFVVHLPLTRQALPVRDADPCRPESKRILIIEDNEDAAESLHEILKLDGHEVAVAAAGIGGIALAREFLPDVVLCDLGLPDGVTGYDVAEELRADRKTRGAYLVALTGYGRPEDKHRSLTAGFDTHLTKPVSIEMLRYVLNHMPQQKSISSL